MIYCLDLYGSPWLKMSYKTHVEWAPPSLHSLGSCFWNKRSSCPISLRECLLAAKWVKCGIFWLFFLCLTSNCCPSPTHFSLSSPFSKLLPYLIAYLMSKSSSNMCETKLFGFLGTIKFFLSSVSISGNGTQRDTLAPNLGVTHNFSAIHPHLNPSANSIQVTFCGISSIGALFFIALGLSILVQGAPRAVKSVPCIGKKVFPWSGQIVQLLSFAVE